MKLKFGFQGRLIASFLVVFTVAAIGVVTFEQSSARRYKTEALEERLDAHAGRFVSYLEQYGFAGIDTLLEIMPTDLRLTLISENGDVLYDNKAATDSMQSHADRPEVIGALKDGHGTDVRTSQSNGQQYFYYAKDDGRSTIVRVALPYNIEVQSFLDPGNAFLYFVVGIFVVGLIFVFYIGRYLGNFADRLREHEARSRTNRLKQEITGNIAHELRTPVTSIRGFLEIVLTGDPGPEKSREFLERAYAQTRTLSELIADMSLLARIDERKGDFEFSAVDAAALLEKVRLDSSESLAAKNISFSFDLPSGLTLKGNESLLYSVFRNLTDNVISHAGKGVAINISATVEGQMASFVFADNGRGLSDPKHLERIFERFYRVERGRTRDTGGSGLGLSIVKNTIALHGGTISARKAEPHGLKFVFTLPKR